MLKRTRYTVFFVLIFSMIFLSACANRKTCYYSLSSIGENHKNYNQKVSRTVAIGPISITQALRTKDILLQGNNDVTISRFHKWEENLDQNIESTIINNLNEIYINKKSQYMAVPLKFRRFTNNDYTVAINIQRFQNKLIKPNKIKNILSVQYSIMNSKNTVIANYSNKYIDYIEFDPNKKQNKDKICYLAVAKVMSRNIEKLSYDIYKKL